MLDATCLGLASCGGTGLVFRARRWHEWGGLLSVRETSMILGSAFFLCFRPCSLFVTIFNIWMTYFDILVYE